MSGTFRDAPPIRPPSSLSQSPLRSISASRRTFHSASLLLLSQRDPLYRRRRLCRLTIRRTPCGCFRRAFLSNDPRRVSALWGSLAVVDVGVDGDVPQMFVLHIFHLLFSMKGPRGVRRAADQHTRPPCRPSDSGRRSRFAHSFALYAVLSIFASCFQGLFQKNRTIPQFS